MKARAATVSAVNPLIGGCKFGRFIFLLQTPELSSSHRRQNKSLHVLVSHSGGTRADPGLSGRPHHAPPGGEAG
jgi:hypothetical protein